jgi:hypothetical protein
MKFVTGFRILVVLSVLALCSTFAGAQYKMWHLLAQGQGESVGINPLNPNTIYAQGNNSWLYVSHDQGVSWTALSSGIAYQTREIIVHPHDTLTMFACDFFNGLKRSTDGGVSWNTVIPNYGIDGQSISYDPVHPDTMWAGNYSDGSVYQSLDRGATWTLRGKSNTVMCTVQIRPDSSQILYAGTGASSLSKSTDGGVTWVEKKVRDANGSAETPRIVINPSNPSIMYATSFNDNSTQNAVWKSTDYGESWHVTSLCDSLISGLLVWSLEMDNLHPDTLYAGTFAYSQAGVYRSTDGGNTWSEFTNGYWPYNSMWNMKIDPINPANVYVAATIGDFGDYGTFKLIDADAGISGTVRNDSTTGTLVNSGILQIEPSGEYIDLSYTAGSYSFYRPSYDTVSTYTLNLYQSNTLVATQTAHFSHGAVVPETVVVTKGTISGTVFNDLNDNGVQDGGELGVAGRQIQLTGVSSANTTTDVNGNYSFANLAAGSYTLAMTPTYGMIQTQPASNGTINVTVGVGSENSTGDNFGTVAGNHVVFSDPRPYTSSTDSLKAIRVVFSAAPNPSSFNDTASCIVIGKQSGRHHGAFSFSGDTATFTPSTAFTRGEAVTINLTSHLQSVGSLPVVPYTMQFSIHGVDSAVEFSKRSIYGGGTGTWAVTTADLNGDGFPDIVEANSGTNSVSVFINNGDGSFSPRVNYTTGAGPSSLVLADVNNDGATDIITGNASGNSYSVLLNHGDGTFATNVDYPLGNIVLGIAVGDLDGDGYVDVVSFLPNALSAMVSKNHGDGTFGAPALTGIYGGFSSGCVADMNGDGGYDIAAVAPQPSSLITIGSNYGGGTFATTTQLTSLATTRTAVAADLNGDNIPEMIVTNAGSNNVSIFPGSGGGAFGARVDLPTGTTPFGLAVGDIDGDSLADIVTANSGSGSVTIYHNNGDGTYTRSDIALAAGANSVALADLNGDGRVDMVVGNPSNNTVTVLLNVVGVNVNDAANWNLVSVPEQLGDMRKSTVYPTAVSSAFGYNAGYQVRDTLVLGVGYWLKFDSLTPVSFYGAHVSPESVTVNANWNLVGSEFDPIDTSLITTNPPGILRTTFFGYNGLSGYGSVDSLLPGQGYWIKVSQAGQIILQASSASPKAPALKSAPPAFSTIMVQDAAGHAQTLRFRADPNGAAQWEKFEMPPSPPAGIFDARFADQHIAEFANPSAVAQYPVSVHGYSGALKISWNVQPAEGNGWSVTTGAQAHPVSGTGSTSVTDATKLALSFNPAGAEVPKVFMLAQNYPNPFNPSTNIQYDVASPSHVTMKIVDLLGREVATLVDRDLSAGRYTQVWNADTYAAGVYYLSMQAVDHSGKQLYRDVKKLLLVK